MGMSPALVTEEQELLIVNLLRNLLARPVAPVVLEGGKRVNVFTPSPDATIIFGDNFSFAPLFSTLSHAQAARMAALFITYAYDPRVIYVHFLVHQMTMTSTPFLGMCDAIEQSFRFVHVRRAARILALHELLAEGRIEYRSESAGAAIFMDFFGKISKDVRLNLLLKFACTNPPILDGGEKMVCLDTVRVWMRCDVLERRDRKVFVHYENWTNKWDEWLEESDSARVQPWVNPTLARFNPVVPRRHVQVAKWEVMRLLRTGFWACENPSFAAPDDAVPVVDRSKNYPEFTGFNYIPNQFLA